MLRHLEVRLYPLTPIQRVRAFGYFVIAALYFYFATLVSARAANGLASGDWFELVQRTILLFLLIIGYGAMGRTLQRQRTPLADMGLVRRPGWPREVGLGAALGWGMLLLSVLPIALTGGLIVTVWTAPHQFGLLFVDLLVLAVAALGEEIAFRGYPFQRLIEAMGPTLATLLMSLLFGMVHLFNPAATRASVTVTIVSGWLLSIAYLRTRALWLPFGWHFGWNVSMGVLFGLPISGITRFSPIFQSNTIGPLWETGGDYGPEGSVVAGLVILFGIFVLMRVTRDYAHRYAQPVIVPGGMPVDLSQMGRVLAPHHDAAVAQAPAPPQFVSIDGIAPAPGARVGPVVERGVEEPVERGGESPIEERGHERDVESFDEAGRVTPETPEDRSR